jgi:predicted TIM-barrel fold metal-dependent hydrolase
MPGPIIDTHTHVISRDHDTYPLAPMTGFPRTQTWFLDHPVAADELLAEIDGAGVTAAVLVHTTAYGFDNRYAAVAPATAPGRFTSVCIVDLTAPDRVERLEHWAGLGMRGTRLFNIPRADPPWLGAPATLEVLDAVRRLDLRVVVTVLEPDVPGVGALAAQAPDLPMALDHCGFTDISDGPPFTRAAPLFALAAQPNVRLKVTTTFLEPALAAGVDPADVLEALADRFGVGRLMWGSDYPQHHSEPYPELVELAQRACRRLSRADQDRFLGGTAIDQFPELGR